VHRGCQAVCDASGSRVFDGEWDSIALYNVLTHGNDDFWQGKKVLDIGANTCGLSVEIARRGAEVVALEPDPYEVTYAQSKVFVDGIVDAERLKLTVVRKGLFDAHEYEGFDVVMCLGLLYHFRYPQLILDYLSTIKMDWLFLSTQVHPGDSLSMYNRIDSSIPFPANFFDASTVLTGWHPTRPLLERMLQSAGFADIASLTNELYVFPKKQPGLTNSAYYRCKRIGIVDPYKEMARFYPR
jgi:tRNA (mo5U34)-methyltransferase